MCLLLEEITTFSPLQTVSSAILTRMAENMDLFLFFLFWEYQVKYYITL